jgi:copper homeostasis protein (lipoprotein)
MLLRCALFLLSLSVLQPAVAQQVTGTATFLQRMTLPPTAVFEARVEDVSRADAPAETIGSVRIEHPGTPPIRFAIDIDPKKVDARRRYSVRATLSVDGRLTMTTDSAYPVLTQGNGREVALVLRAVGPRPAIVGGPRGRPLGALPASFQGDLPCADCAALRYRLNLFADQSYFLGTESVGRGDGPRYDIGTWALSADGRTLSLKGSREPADMFRVIDPRTLRRLAPDGRDLESTLNASLTRSATFAPIEPRLAMRGMYHYFADTGSFQECLTGQRWPVAQIEDNAALERAYLGARQEPKQELLAVVDGEVRSLPRMEGPGSQPTLVVRRFIEVRPKETCGPRQATAGLLDMYWVLTTLNGRPVAATPARNQREASLVLHSQDQRVSGSGGCNRITGSYRLQGSELTFGPLAGSMMACADGMNLEQEFLETLPRVTGWRIAGIHLELTDAGGAVVARLESRPLR